MRQTIAVASKELRQILRDKRTLLILLFIPAFFLLLFGYALNFDIRNVTLAVQDQDRSTRSRELVSAFVNSGYFSLVGYEDSPKALDRLVDENKVRAILSIPAGFERDLSQRQPVRNRTGQHLRHVHQLQGSSFILGRGVSLHELAETGAVDVGDASEIEQQFLPTLLQEGIDLVLEDDVSALVQRDVPSDRDDRHRSNDSLLDLHSRSSWSGPFREGRSYLRRRPRQPWLARDVWKSRFQAGLHVARRGPRSQG